LPTSAGTNVVVVVAGALDAGPAGLPDPLDPPGFDAESDPPHAATRTTNTTHTTPSGRTIAGTLGPVLTCAVMGDVLGLHQVAQHVDDLDRAVAFYRDVLGLPLVGRFDPPGLAFFDLGDTRLLLETGAPSALLYLRVEDPAAALERLRSCGVAVEQDAHVIFADTDG
jgi:methylmalonyl-CoA/ethylmalonyl-CoA epimerase